MIIICHYISLIYYTLISKLTLHTFETSKDLVSIFDDISATNGIPFVSGI